MNGRLAYTAEVRRRRFHRAFERHAEEMYELVRKVIVGKTAGWELIREALAIIHAVNDDVNRRACIEEVNGCDCGYYSGAARRSVHAAWERRASRQGRGVRL